MRLSTAVLPDDRSGPVAVPGDPKRGGHPTEPLIEEPAALLPNGPRTAAPDRRGRWQFFPRSERKTPHTIGTFDEEDAPASTVTRFRGNAL